MIETPYRIRFVGGILQGREDWCSCIPEHVRTNAPHPVMDYFLVRLRGRRCVLVEETLCRRITAWVEINRQISLRIISDHQSYIVCTVCGMLAPRTAQAMLPYCPSCHGYRFDSTLETIADAADRIAARELPWRRLSYSL